MRRYTILAHEQKMWTNGTIMYLFYCKPFNSLRRYSNDTTSISSWNIST